ncbi:MAG: T9SS C-terminal target domain-containing protein [Calditrichaeota bacterium]|nr:MAG: T9SS C-terminal target domain-containing protein [Calditrichota bacterium]
MFHRIRPRFRPGFNIFKCSILCLIGFIATNVAEIQAQAISQNNNGFISSNLPILIIDTQGREIVDENRIVADMGIICNENDKRNYLADSCNHYNGRIEIELRGTTSLTFPKKPYRIETQDTSGENYNVPLLGMPAENDWILHNPYSDKSLMRNVLAYKLARDTQEYASRSAFVEVIVNEDYKGVYVLLEKIKRDKNRVDISPLEPDDIAGDALTGGYIIKIDNVSGEHVETWQSSHNIRFQYHYPKPTEIVPEQKEYIQNFINQFEKSISTPNCNSSAADYSQIIDLDSFVHYFLISELTKNIDSYRLSVYMYKDRDSKNGKLTLAPVWDFNLAFGNADFFGGEYIWDWGLNTLNSAEARQSVWQPLWWEYLVHEPEFINRVVNRWQELRAGAWQTEKLLQYIDSKADTLREAQARNFERWPILGKYVWPNAFVGDTWEEDVDFLKNWLTARLEWLDDNIPELALSANVNNYLTKFDEKTILRQNYPNPFHSNTTIQYNLPEGVSTKLGIYNIIGQRIRLLKNTFESAGQHFVNWDGRDDLGNRVSAGVYFYSLKSGSEERMMKMILLHNF